MRSNPIKGAARWNGKVGGQNYGGTSPAEMARRNARYAKTEAEAHQLDAKVRAALDSYGLPNIGTYLAAAREFNKCIKGHSGPTLIAALTAMASKYIVAMKLNQNAVIDILLNVFGVSLLGWLTQDIALVAGSNYVSTYLNPLVRDMRQIADGILPNLTYIENTAGLRLQQVGGVWVNDIGDWRQTEGYKVEMANPGVLTIRGFAPVIPYNTPIPVPILGPLTQYIPFLQTANQDVVLAVAGITANMKWVKTPGGGIYWPAMAINTLIILQPGRGYELNMTAPDTLIYPAL